MTEPHHQYTPEPPPSVFDSYTRSAKLIRVVDGDTLELKIDLGWEIAITERVRLLGVDTPECRGPEREAGRYVKDDVMLFFRDNSDDLVIQSHTYKPDKYGRTLCKVFAGTVSLNRYLLEKGLGWETDDDGKLLRARDIDLLYGVPEGLRQVVRESLL